MPKFRLEKSATKELYDIFATEDIPIHGVNRGDQGGKISISDPTTFDQKFYGDAWVEKGSIVDRGSTMGGNSLVSGCSHVSQSHLRGNAHVHNARIYDVEMEGDTSIREVVLGNLSKIRMFDFASISGTNIKVIHTVLRGNSKIRNNGCAHLSVTLSELSGDAYVHNGSALVSIRMADGEADSVYACSTYRQQETFENVRKMRIAAWKGGTFKRVVLEREIPEYGLQAGAISGWFEGVSFESNGWIDFGMTVLSDDVPESLDFFVAGVGLVPQREYESTFNAPKNVLDTIRVPRKRNSR